MLLYTVYTMYAMGTRISLQQYYNINEDTNVLDQRENSGTCRKKTNIFLFINGLVFSTANLQQFGPKVGTCSHSR